MTDALTLGLLSTERAADRPDLLAAPVVDAAAPPSTAPIAVFVAPIDPELADTAAFCAAYDVAPAASANCVVVSGKRAGEQRWAAAVVLATTRADVNGAVRRLLDVRKVSFAAMADAVEATGMQYGGITPIGLPAGWPIFVDAAVAAAGPVVIGSGIRGSKIVIDGAALGRPAGRPGGRGPGQPGLTVRRVGGLVDAVTVVRVTRRQDLRADQRDVLQIGQVQHLQVGALHAGRCPRSPMVSVTSATVPANGLSRACAGVRPIAAARRSNSASFAPTQTGCATE